MNINEQSTTSNEQRITVGIKKFDEKLELERNPHSPRLGRG
jgi:hypothetical protein